MAATYTLIDSTWRSGPLLRFLNEWVAQARPAVLPPVAGQRNGPALEAHIFAEGSLRGVQIGLRGRAFRTGALDITMATLANPVDWALGFSLARALLEAGRGTLTGPDGSPVNVASLTAYEADAEGMNTFRNDARSLREELAGRGRTWAALRSPGYDLFVVPGDLPKTRDEADFACELGASLRVRATRYHQAAAMHVLQTGDGTPVGVWRLDDAIVDALDHVAVVPATKQAGRVFAWNEIVSLLGSYMEVAATDGQRYFLPALDPGDPAGAEVIERLLRGGVDMGAFFAARVMVGA